MDGPSKLTAVGPGGAAQDDHAECLKILQHSPRFSRDVGVTNVCDALLAKESIDLNSPRQENEPVQAFDMCITDLIQQLRHKTGIIPLVGPVLARGRAEQ